MHVFDVGADNKLRTRSSFSDFMVDGVKCGPDGVALRRRRQSLGVEQRRPRARLQRRDRVDSGGQADRPHPPARGDREPVLRRAEAESPVHDRESVLYAVYVVIHAGRCSRINPRSQAPNPKFQEIPSVLGFGIWGFGVWDLFLTAHNPTGKRTPRDAHRFQAR